MKDNYTYAAIFKTNEEGSIEITFPMFDGTFSYAPSRDTAIKAAQDLLALTINDYESRGVILPDENIIPETVGDEQIFYINVWMPYHRPHVKEIYVKKTITLPQWLDTLGKQNNINFSAVLVRGLKKELHIDP